MRKIICAGVMALILAIGISVHAVTVTNIFGFSGKEDFPIDPGISLLHSADLDGDGLNDLIVANNQRSKIDLLYNMTGKTNPPPVRKMEINDLPPDSRFRLDSIPVDEHIAAMSVADFNGDGKPDIAIFGDGKNLEVIYNQGTNGWSDPKRWNIDDGQLSPNALADGDLNGDGLRDLLLLGDNGSSYFFAQRKNHTLAEPVKIPYSGTPHAVQIVDINGDGRNDLLFVDFDSATPFRFRLQDNGGQLGPEIYFKTPPVRSFWADNLEGNKKLYVVTIARDSGRATVSEFTQKPAEILTDHFKRGQFQIMPLIKSDSTRGLAWSDVNGDGLADLLVAEPATGQLAIYLQETNGTLAPSKTFPSLAGVTQIVADDVNGDGHPEIFLLSRDENSVGMTEFDKDGKLPFPTVIPLNGKPLVMAIGTLKPGDKPTLCIITDKDGQRYLMTRSADGKIKSQKLSENFKSNPTTLAIQDVNQDGRPDLVVLIPYEKVKVLLQRADGSFDEQDIDPPGGAIEQPWLASADIDGDGKPELLLPQKNFIRAVVLERQTNSAAMAGTNAVTWVFRVKDQINGSDTDSQIVGATAISDPKSSVPSIFLLDGANKQLTLCERDTNGVWQIVRNIDLPVSDFNKLQSVKLAGQSTVAFLGQNTVAWMPLAGKVWDFTALDGYDTPIENGFLNDEIAGDLTGDGRKEIIFMETARNYLDVVFFDKNHKLVPGDRWQVFEQHTFRNRTDAMPEPREALVTDVTGDGKNDLIVLVHDRILVYTQE